ncbi:hypothetical protein BX661DRAFT_21854 [Kickxella alabastrina]|uniref:uncharacterized protein n=1 Tax=Kickxella alabastrina TaxID=61397 RepID=UPI002220E7F7|nr:uncharacterized protein BX661DRAFT_21854 [Kickxella alabastrina]KAI7827193.1 hypothetical protein BX661DRAFT_21854 [Kickxella alabastrina]
MLVSLNLKIFIESPLASLFMDSQGRELAYDCLEVFHLLLYDTNYSFLTTKHLSFSDEFVPLPSLKYFNIQEIQHFGKVPFLRGNNCTLERLRILVNSWLTHFLHLPGIFSPSSHPNLYTIIFYDGYQFGQSHFIMLPEAQIQSSFKAITASAPSLQVLPMCPTFLPQSLIEQLKATTTFDNIQSLNIIDSELEFSVIVLVLQKISLLTTLGCRLGSAHIYPDVPQAEAVDSLTVALHSQGRHF